MNAALHLVRRLTLAIPAALAVTVGACFGDGSPAGADARSQWFHDAKFGIFVHWGLYSELGNNWKGKSYYGSAEWLMPRARISAAEYAQVAAAFNPTNFHAKAWARIVRDAGARYLVITAKHHDGFAMFGSKVSPFNIVDATPFQRDPMKALAEVCRRHGVKLGFYYSQFLDWHEPNGGGNNWDFREETREYRRYYAEKSVPQIKELLSNYGPLGLVRFDIPGGLTRDETLAFMDSGRQLQPDCLISSRVGHNLGDFLDFGDSELPPAVVQPPWEALFTHNDSWGFVKTDANFKTPREILRLLADTAARGGKLLLNVGPDGTGRIPEISQRYLREVGEWLAANGESIYGTTCSPIPDQPWGVATLTPGRLYLHVFDRPKNGILFVPCFEARVERVTLLGQRKTLHASQHGQDLRITLPAALPDARDTVVVVRFRGTLSDSWPHSPEILSRQFDLFSVGAARARPSGKAVLKSVTSSQYFGNWKHDYCVQNLQTPADRAEFSFRFLEPGDYRVALEYACSTAGQEREGVVEAGSQWLYFQSLLTGEHATHAPLMFIRHNIGVVSITTPGIVPISVLPKNDGAELFRLRRVLVEPVK